jgi:hypothetical protein
VDLIAAEGQIMGLMLYLRFWWECAREAWHGSWSRANALATIFGGTILAASAWWLGLTKEAPSSIEGTVGFALFIYILSLLSTWIVIFLVWLLGAPARLDSRKLSFSDLEHLLPGRLVFNEFLYGGDFGLMCLNLTGKFDIEQLRDTFTEIKVPAPANSSARIRISLMNGHQNADSKYYFYVLDRKGTPRLVKNIYEEQQVRLDARACFQLKFAHEDSYTLHDQASLRVTVSSWSR